MLYQGNGASYVMRDRMREAEAARLGAEARKAQRASRPSGRVRRATAALTMLVPFRH